MDAAKKLSEVYISEQNEDWKKAISQYEALYREEPSGDIAIHFAFLCWYLLWQWDQISFPGETISPYERMSAEVRNGISQSSLASHLDAAAKQLLSCTRTPVQYLIVLVHMKKIYPYFFRDETFSELAAQQLLNSIREEAADDPGVNAIRTYLQDDSMAKITPEEKEAACGLFPNGSLMQTYFTWLFH